jgi:hypothetical protein
VCVALEELNWLIGLTSAGVPKLGVVHFQKQFTLGLHKDCEFLRVNARKLLFKRR